MLAKTNFFGETIEVPAGHTYSTPACLNDARAQLRRWSEEWREKKVVAMDNFCGRREQNFNESETGSSISASRVGNKPENAQKLANAA